jgi:hypothetical protein
MTKPEKSFLILAILILAVGTATAQEGPPKKRVPQLTTDDVVVNRTPAIPIDEAAPDSSNTAGDWTRRSLAGGLSVEMPGSPMELDIPFPEALRAQGDVWAKGYTNGKWVMVIVYLQGPTPAPDPEQLMRSVISGFGASPGISDLNYRFEPAAGSGSLLKGTFLHNGVPMGMEGLVRTNRNRAWVMLGQFISGDAASATATTRIVRSLRIGS